MLYGYDNRDVKMHVERALGTATTQRINYTYDDIDQLLTEISTELTPVVNNNFTYDAAQNRTASTVDSTSSSFTINNVNQINAYTLSGSPVTVTHDDNGNTTQLGPKTLTWDDANRLTSVTIPGVSKTEYQYDGLDRRRIAKAYTWNSGASDWDLQSERRFIYDGMDLVEERDGSNNLVAFYTRTGNIGEVLSRTTSSDTYYYHYDGNGNVVSLTDANENVVAMYEYDAYGNLQASSGAEVNNNPFRLSTKYFDAATGLYDYGFRFYDPVTGRWLNRDPIGEEGGLNLYAFVGNRPGDVVDEYGLIDDGAPADIDQYIEEIKSRKQQTIVTGSKLTQFWYRLLYGELPSLLIGGGVSKTIQVSVKGAKIAKNTYKTIKLLSIVKKDARLLRYAKQLSPQTSAEINSLLGEFLKGNTNPGIGTKYLKCGIYYLRGRKGGRVFYRVKNSAHEILGYADKSNEKAVIQYLLKLYK